MKILTLLLVLLLVFNITYALEPSSSIVTIPSNTTNTTIPPSSPPISSPGGSSPGGGGAGALPVPPQPPIQNQSNSNLTNSISCLGENCTNQIIEQNIVTENQIQNPTPIISVNKVNSFIIITTFFIIIIILTVLFFIFKKHRKSKDMPAAKPL